ncbi:hypothetical protein EV361DRAFT_775343, partial [Lentinula raphanica]
PVDLETWHRRLGHAGITRVRMMVQKNLVDGMEVVGPVDTAVDDCDSCHMGKAKRRPFDGVTTRESRLLERVHVDL